MLRQHENAAGHPFAFLPKRKTGTETGTAVEQKKVQGADKTSKNMALVHAFPSVQSNDNFKENGKYPQPYKKGTSISENAKHHLHIDLPLQLPQHRPTFGGATSTPTIRKKSGELVRPSLKSSESTSQLSTLDSPRPRTKSAPATPSATPKSVHFDTQLENVKWFLAGQKPLAVSRDGSPCWETSEGDTTDTNLNGKGPSISGGYPFPVMATPKEAMPMQTPMLRLKPISVPIPLLSASYYSSYSSSSSDPWFFHVRLDSLALTPSSPILTGTILVLNIAYAKRINARFTLDNWATTSEVSASYVSSLKNGAFDKFEFHVPLGGYGYGGPGGWLEGRRMEVCVKYWIEGKEKEVWWDNNLGRNYVVGFETIGGPAGSRRKRTGAMSMSKKMLAAATWRAFEESDSSPARTPDAGSRADDEEEPGEDGETSLKARYDFKKSFQRGAWVPVSPSSSPRFATMPKSRRMTMPMVSPPSSFAMFARTRGSPREVEWTEESTTPSVEYPVRRHTRVYERTSYFDFTPSMVAGNVKMTPPVSARDEVTAAATEREGGSSTNTSVKIPSSVNNLSDYISPITSPSSSPFHPLSNRHHDPGLIPPTPSMVHTDTDLDSSLTTPSMLMSPDVLSPAGEDGPSGATGRAILAKVGSGMGVSEHTRMIGVGSQGYYSLVDQFCFFTGSKNAKDVRATATVTAAQVSDEHLKERVEDYLSVALRAF